MKRDGRLHLRHSREVLDKVRRIADKRNVSVTHLVDQFFLALVTEEEQENRPKTDEELGVEQA